MVTTARRAFLKALDIPAIEAAIRAVEVRTTGELRVSIAGYFHGDPHRLAMRAFRRLGMNTTRHHNGVLFFIAPARRQVVVLGDAGIHARVSEPFWRAVAERLAAALKTGQVNQALLQGIQTVGEELARHFPAHGTANPNELPDAVDLSPV